MNYTGKTQYLFRVNKGVLDPSDDVSLNEFLPHDRRPVPFRNMIYIGDGLTDVPCMRLVKSSGGQSVAVYKLGGLRVAERLLRDGRVDFIAPADYAENAALDRLVRTMLGKIALAGALSDEHAAQINKSRLSAE